MKSFGTLLLLAAASFAADSITVRTGAYTDMGQVVKGRDFGGSEIDNLYLSRVGVTLASEVRIDDRLQFKVGAGGLFWYPFPVSPTQWWAKRIQFGPGVSEASFQYDLTPPEADPGQRFVKGGFFAYKYNPDAQNLGEYLLRSEAYPGLVQTGGWSFLNSAVYQSLGAQVRVSAFDGRFISDFMLFSEMDRPPISDMSPAYVGTLRPGMGLEVGAGVALHRFIPIKPSAQAPRVKWQGEFGQGNSYLIPNPDYDPNDDTTAHALNPRYVEDTTRFYSLRGIKLMARASFDPKQLLDEVPAFLGPSDLRVYAEAALLGVEDRPFYYENVLHRIPVMFGVNLPSARLLDLLSVQFEYYANPWRNSQQNFYTFPTTRPVWGVDSRDGYQGPAPRFTRDDWKWSVNAARTLMPGLQVQVQAANDHLRLKDPNAIPSHTPLTEFGKHWYYVVRLQWGV